ncbi:hypothetical protein Q4574_18475 [Aliiglaciecola sp. 3_MG-2023]|uniref:hypothetical protein n=1 Tax=Aliiglaciecola sp. 3_MG-2023 TaxID=3062644 RepID=UPI0026E42634|nr:hypothetical protein [Aliiglaciecola sp. 3_MG-2023]MDO6695289.1 hypothetical protein [Aliiglaciecola sp. 3_MG-2023]
MEINNNSQLSSIYQSSKNQGADTTHSNQLSNNHSSADKVTLSQAGLIAETKFQEVADQYDPTNMSYNELTRMSSELQLDGLITSQEGLAMRAPPSRDFDADEKYDVLALARKSVEFDQSIGTAQNKDAQLRANVLDVLERLQS